MCFSAAASFAGGTILTAIGAATVRKNELPSRRLFAVIPFVFGAQQLSEGVVWLALQSPGHDRLLSWATAFFLIMALVVWPFLVPLALYRMEEDGRRKDKMKTLLEIGLAVALLHGFALVTYPRSAQVAAFHIAYGLAAPDWLIYTASAGYLLATIGPLFLSSVRRVYLFGLIILISYAATFYFYRECLTSVWCFFAALASAVIYWIIGAPADACDDTPNLLPQA